LAAKADAMIVTARMPLVCTPVLEKPTMSAEAASAPSCMKVRSMVSLPVGEIFYHYIADRRICQPLVFGGGYGMLLTAG